IELRFDDADAGDLNVAAEKRRKRDLAVDFRKGGEVEFGGKSIRIRIVTDLHLAESEMRRGQNAKADIAPDAHGTSGCLARLCFDLRTKLIPVDEAGTHQGRKKQKDEQPGDIGQYRV